jgi:hypothetical protein
MREYRKWTAPKVSIQFRSKEDHHFTTVKKKGPKTDPTSGRYYLRFTDKEGKQQRKPLGELLDYNMAAQEANTPAAVLLAQFRGVEIPEDQKPENKTAISDAVAAYLASKSGMRSKTKQAYKLNPSVLHAVSVLWRAVRGRR